MSNHRCKAANHRCMSAIASASVLWGCNGIRPDGVPGTVKPPLHVDVAYTQFVLPSGGNNETPVNLSAMPIVVAECGGKPHKEVSAGGGDILLTIATSLLGKLAAGVVKDLEQWVGAEIAKYSISWTGAAVRVPFYSPALWYKKPGSDDSYSCFAIAVARCEKPAEGEHACKDAHQDTRAVIIGQFRHTREFMQVRPLAAFVRGFDARRSSGKASLAASLKFTSVWWDGHAGHVETPTEMKVLSGTFVPADDDTTRDLAVLVPGDDREGAPGATAPPVPVSWDKQPLLPRPPLSPSSEGTVEITATVAEANTPPGDLKFLKKVLGDQSTDISAALKSALTELLPAAPAKKK